MRKLLGVVVLVLLSTSAMAGGKGGHITYGQSPSFVYKPANTNINVNNVKASSRSYSKASAVSNNAVNVSTAIGSAGGPWGAVAGTVIGSLIAASISNAATSESAPRVVYRTRPQPPVTVIVNCACCPASPVVVEPPK